MSVQTDSNLHSNLRMLRQLLFILVLSCCIAKVSDAQTDSNNVKWLTHTGGKGIYVFTWPDLVSESTPINGVSGYLIERKSSTETNWKTLDVLQAPTTQEDFETNLALASEVVSDPWGVNIIRPSEVWSRISQYHRLDSLGWWSGMMAVRLASGAAYLDTSAVSGVQYRYRVSRLRDTVKSESITSTSISFPLKSAIDRGIGQTPVDRLHAVYMEWKFGASDQLRTARVFRKEGIGTIYREIDPNRHLYIDKAGRRFSIEDSLITANTTYQYFIIPQDAYGNPGPASDTIRVSTHDFANHPLPEHFKVFVSPTENNVQLEWKLRNAKDVRSIQIYRSDKWDSAYTQIAEVAGTDSEYVDRAVAHAKTFYYYLVLNAMDGSVSQPSAKQFALTRTATGPIRPSQVSATVEQEGVRVHWKMRNDPDIDGYYVYRGEGFASAKLQAITSMIVTSDSEVSYLDTSRDLISNHSYGYAVVAENNSHALGDLSDTAYVFYRGAAKPRRPYELHVMDQRGVVNLVWTNMREYDPATFGYNVYRREGNGEYAKITKEMIPGSSNHYDDSSASAGKGYEYAVSTVDISGNSSDLSNPQRIVIEGEAVAPSVLEPSGLSVQNLAEGIELSWVHPLDSTIAGYDLYRKTETSEYAKLSSVAATETSFIDKTAAANGTYFYMIRSRNAKNEMSNPSPSVVIYRKK